jgi:phenylpyruvate tautomerase PptA (4-oxalocrotonate tautomerase family)
MSITISSPSVLVPAPLDPKREITPKEEGSNKVISSVAKEISESTPLFPRVTKVVVEYMVENDWYSSPEEQLDRLISPITTEVSESSPLFPVIAKIVAEYMVDGNWYTALQRLKSSLPEKIIIPLLPSDIYNFLQSQSPISGPWGNGTSSVIDNHRLFLVPEEFGCLDNLQKNILNPYAQQEYADENNPLHFGFIEPKHRAELTAAFPKTHWVLMSQLPGTIGMSWDNQMLLVESLRNTSLVNYERVSLQDIFVANSTQVIATGKALFPRNRHIHLKETPSGRFAVNFHPIGVFYQNVGSTLQSDGIAVARKL